MATPTNNLQAIEAGLTSATFWTWDKNTLGYKDITDAQTALAELRQQLADYQALSDAVLELARIEQAYTRLPDNTWPEWDSAYDAMYAINKRIRAYQQSPENSTTDA